MYDTDGQLLYIGQSIRLAERMSQHAETKAWWPPARIDIEQCHSKAELNDREKHAIQTEQPLHNIKHLRRRSESASESYYSHKHEKSQLVYNSRLKLYATKRAMRGISATETGHYFDLSNLIRQFDVQQEWLQLLDALHNLGNKIQDERDCIVEDENESIPDGWEWLGLLAAIATRQLWWREWQCKDCEEAGLDNNHRAYIVGQWDISDGTARTTWLCQNGMRRKRSFWAPPEWFYGDND